MSHRQHRCVPAASFPARLPLPVHIKPLLPPSLKPARHACTRSWWPRAGHGSELWPKSLIRHAGASSNPHNFARLLEPGSSRGCQGQGHGSWSGSTASRMNAETTRHPTLGHVWAPCHTQEGCTPPPLRCCSLIQGSELRPLHQPRWHTQILPPSDKPGQDQADPIPCGQISLTRWGPDCNGGAGSKLLPVALVQVPAAPKLLDLAPVGETRKRVLAMGG